MTCAPPRAAGASNGRCFLYCHKEGCCTSGGRAYSTDRSEAGGSLMTTKILSIEKILGIFLVFQGFSGQLKI